MRYRVQTGHGRSDEVKSMLRSVLASTAALGLVFAPLAAQAGTRASDSHVAIAPALAADARVASPLAEDGEQLFDDIAFELVLVLFLGGAFALHELISSPGIIK